MRRRLIAVTVMTVLSASCSLAGTEPSTPAGRVRIEADDGTLRTVYATWINLVGLVRDDPEVWRARLEEACSQGVWDRDVAITLAERNVDADTRSTGATVGDPTPSPSTDTAADALWLMAVQRCRDLSLTAPSEGPPFSHSKGSPVV